MGISYSEIIDERPAEPQRTSEDIISSICGDLELIGKEEDTDECI